MRLTMTRGRRKIFNAKLPRRKGAKRASDQGERRLSARPHHRLLASLRLCAFALNSRRGERWSLNGATGAVQTPVRAYGAESVRVAT